MSHRGPFNWSHIIGNGDIICIFERHAIPSPLYSRVLLKVMRDHDILEQIDIMHLSRDAMGQPQPSQHGQTKPIFAVVVKLPCLAVKYPEGSGCWSLSVQCQSKAQFNQCYCPYETVITSSIERQYLNWSHIKTINSYNLPRYSGSQSAFASEKRPAISQTTGKETMFNIGATTFYRLTHRRSI
ncbi:unnamed protein product [Aspergillus oryzae RIB40]|uniref:DNA, SC003 n=2 Tax=Aspergillus oryzae TaxID=5062 RepID=Q2UM34_ASPOR|nr:unnamed protein product [Aspergillus oryzae RIB40]EIT73356.1 hypothetical protein Ao3042_10788 [Aspergillus oryzae 3.042]KDE78318.1 hypothetical protein AO1008_04364 [Aspergillus oryzae 100-8]KOC12028.1 hypothetical protein AFLA70_263g001051 [Aspergillus flavus AF70]BAE57381.1 unnamed protein product [Aspergillus oryzae RIB40]|eukprot:EIT73356.1 hypothetical protein Ao3042_10788 [Aspergillus oryzae 3.042]